MKHTSDMEQLKSWLRVESINICENIKPDEYSAELATIQKVQAVIGTIESDSINNRFKYFKQLLSKLKGIFK